MFFFLLGAPNMGQLIMTTDTLRNIGYVLLASSLAPFFAVNSVWVIPVAMVIFLAGAFLIVAPHKLTRGDAPTVAEADRPAPIRNGRAEAQAQLEAVRAERAELERLANGADAEIAVIHLSGNPPGNALDIVAGANTYQLKFSSSGGDDVWVYGDDPSIRSLAVERYARRGDNVDATGLRAERGATSVRVNQRVFAVTHDNRVIQALILSVRYYNAGDDTDEVRVAYRVYQPGQFLIPAL